MKRDLHANPSLREEIAAEVREWYLRSSPEMGYFVEEGRFGVYSRNAHLPGMVQASVRGLAAGDVPGLMEEIRSRFPGCRATIRVDERETDRAIGGVLAGAGGTPGKAELFLAHVGPVPDEGVPTGVTIEAVVPEGIGEYVETKQRGFANSDDPPDSGDVAAEAAVRRSEMEGGGARFLLARAGGEPAGIAGYYTGPVAFFFQLAVRVPFRGRGIARALLLRVLQEAYAGGARAVILNADPEDTPIEWYRRMGFTDEVYWRRPYRFPLE